MTVKTADPIVRPIPSPADVKPPRARRMSATAKATPTIDATPKPEPKPEPKAEPTPAEARALAEAEARASFLASFPIRDRSRLKRALRAYQSLVRSGAGPMADAIAVYEWALSATGSRHYGQSLPESIGVGTALTPSLLVAAGDAGATSSRALAMLADAAKAIR